MLLNKERALRLMADEGIDGVVGSCIENVSYITGFHARAFRGVKATQYYGVFSRHEGSRTPIVLPSLRLPGYVADGFPLEDLYVYGKFSVVRAEGSDDDPLVRMLTDGLKVDGRFTSPFEALRAALADVGLLRGTLAVDEMHITPRQWASLTELLPDAKIVPGYDFIRKVRMVKTEEEVRRLQKSVHVIEQGIRESVAMMRPGTTERDLVCKMQEVIGRMGGMPGIVGLSAGSRSSVLLNESDYALQSGDLVRYDVGCIHDLYWSDMGRVFCIGEPTTKQKEIYAALVEGQAAAVHSIRPGVRACDVYRTAISTIQKAGIPDYKRPHCGHGVGLEFYDVPNLRPDDETVLEEGTVLAVETPYYCIGIGGFQIEDNLVVTHDGIRLLSSLPRRIMTPI